MRERIDRFVKETPSKGHILQLVNKLDLILKIDAESETYYLSFKDGKIDYHCSHSESTATISGNIAHLQQLFDGELKLVHGVNMKYFMTDCPFRVQLVLESLFYLVKPLPA